MTSEDVQTNLRLPAKLKERLLEAAVQNKRSLSAEVSARLESSFNAPLDQDLMIKMLTTEVERLTQELRTARATALPLAAKIGGTVEDLIHHVMELRGLSFEDALLLLTTRGVALDEAAPVTVIQVAKGTTLDEVRAWMRAIGESAPSDTHLFYEQVEGIESTRLLNSEADKQAFLSAAKQSKG